MIICLYVDDMLIFGASLDIVHKTKSLLASKFDMKDMGEASVILGFIIIRKDDSIKDEKIGFDGYISIWILRIYHRYIGI